MNIIQNCLRSHPNLPFWMTPEVILQDIHSYFGFYSVANIERENYTSRYSAV